MNAPTALDLAGFRVAVVDDNRNFRDLLRAMLRAFGVRRVDSIAEPDELIPFLCQNYVDLVFLDLIMPGVDGIQLAREIRHKTGVAKRAMPIVLVTGHASRATVVKAVAAGIDDIIVKPVSPQTILRRSRRLLLKPPQYVAGLDGYFGPDTVERRQAVERRLSADRWRLLKAQPYRVISASLPSLPNIPGLPSLPNLPTLPQIPNVAKSASLRRLDEAAGSPPPAADGTIVPGLHVRPATPAPEGTPKGAKAAAPAAKSRAKTPPPPAKPSGAARSSARGDLP